MIKRIKLFIEVLIHEYKRKRERCSWCGWYLHPQFFFKVDRPSRALYGKIGDEFVCNHCYEIDKLRKK